MKRQRAKFLKNVVSYIRKTKHTFNQKGSIKTGFSLSINFCKCHPFRTFHRVQEITTANRLQV